MIDRCIQIQSHWKENREQLRVEKILGLQFACKRKKNRNDLYPWLLKFRINDKRVVYLVAPRIWIEVRPRNLKRVFWRKVRALPTSNCPENNLSLSKGSEAKKEAVERRLESEKLFLIHKRHSKTVVQSNSTTMRFIDFPTKRGETMKIAKICQNLRTVIQQKLRKQPKFRRIRRKF